MFENLLSTLRTAVTAAAIGTLMTVGAQAASVTVIADVNADADEIGNRDLYDGILGSSNNVLFSRTASQQSSTLSYYNGLSGVSATASSATLTSGLLAGVDLLVVTTQFNTAIGYGSGEYSAVSNFLAAGGDVLFVLEASSTAVLGTYNAFLAGIGSAIQYEDSRTVAPFTDSSLGDTDVSDSSMSFEVDAYGHLFGGQTIGEDARGNVFAATESFAAPVPLPAGLPLLIGGLMGFAGLRRMTRKG